MLLALTALLSACQVDVSVFDPSVVNSQTPVGADEPDSGTHSDTDTNSDNGDDFFFDTALFDTEGTQIQSVFDPSLCLAVASDKKLKTEACSTSENHVWIYTANRLVNKSTPKYCLDSTNGKSLAPVYMVQCDSAASQTWVYRDNVLQSFQQAIDLDRNTNEVILYPRHGFENQQWLLKKVTDSEDSSTDTGSDETFPLTEMCAANAEIAILTTQPLMARKGSVLSSTLYEPANKTNSKNTHNPVAITIEVMADGQPLAGCHVGWATFSADNGWAFPVAFKTDWQGRTQAWWTAGTADVQTLTPFIRTASDQIKTVTIDGYAYDHNTRSNSIHINWNSPQWDYFSVDATPLTMPETTYYSAINFPGGYTGLQTNKYLFSAWDVNGINADIVDPGIAQCTGFGVAPSVT